MHHYYYTSYFAEKVAKLEQNNNSCTCCCVTQYINIYNILCLSRRNTIMFKLLTRDSFVGELDWTSDLVINYTSVCVQKPYSWTIIDCEIVIEWYINALTDGMCTLLRCLRLLHVVLFFSHASYLYVRCNIIRNTYLFDCIYLLRAKIIIFVLSFALYSTVAWTFLFFVIVQRLRKRNEKNK
jgi:hypothetical protein